MGLYNSIFGHNADAGTLLSALGLTAGDFYRYRDAYLSEAGEIAVYTRGGGGNRECYCSSPAHLEDCGVPMQDKLRHHPLYLRDEDDGFDCTYATFYFRLPEDTTAVTTGMEAQPAREDLWRALLGAK